MKNLVTILLSLTFLTTICLADYQPRSSRTQITKVSLSGNLDSEAAVLSGGTTDIPVVTAPNVVPGSTTSYADLNVVSEQSLSTNILDSNATSKTVHLYFYKTGNSEYTCKVYVNSEGLGDTEVGLPRLIGTTTLTFDLDGNNLQTQNLLSFATWADGANQQLMKFNFRNLTSLSSTSTIEAIVDNCPKDPNKLLSGNCGCGLPDTDMNNEDISFCRQAPTKIVITKRAEKFKLKLEKYSVPVKYMLEFKQSGSSEKRYIVSNSNKLLTDLSSKTWQVRYRVRYIGSSKAVKSRFSNWQKLRENTV